MQPRLLSLCFDACIDFHSWHNFVLGFPKEDLFRHLQDGFGRDDEECAREEYGQLERHGRGFKCDDPSPCGGLCHRETVHASAVILAKQGLEPEHRAAAMFQ